MHNAYASKLVSKERAGAKVRKKYDEARTPYQRLLGSNTLSEEKREELAKLYATLNPVKLRVSIENNLEALWKLADRPDVGKTSTREPREPAARG